MGIGAKLLVEGLSIRYDALCRGTRNDVQNFINRLPDDEEARVLNYLMATCHTGIRNPTTVRKEEGDVFRIRPPGSQVRLYFFWGKQAEGGRRRVVIVHCVRKKQQRARPEDLKKAQRLVDRFRQEGEKYEDG